MEQGSEAARTAPERSATPGEAWKDEKLVRAYLDGIRGALPLAREQIEMMLRLVEGGVSPVERIADLGCGSGVLTKTLIGRYPGASATLVDFSQPMMAEARTLLAGADCRFVEADLSSSAWASPVRGDAPFDVIVSGFAIHHLTDERKRKLYGEVFELLRPGGMFVNTEHVSSPTRWVEGMFNELLIDSFQAQEQARGSGMTREEVAKRYVNRDDKEANLLAGVEEQCEWLREIGFEDVDCYLKILEIAMFGGRRPA